MATTVDHVAADRREVRASGLGRVCLVGINYAPETTGIAPYTTAMARAWADAGAVVDVVTGVPHYPAWRVEDERYARGRSWHERDGAVALHRVRHHVPASADLRGRARMEASFLRRATPLVRRSAAGVVVAVTPSMSALAAAVTGARGRPVGVVVQDLTGRGAQESGSTGGAAASLIGRAEVALLRRCAAVGVITPQFGATLTAAGVPADRIVEVGNFTHVRPSASTRDEACARLGWDPSVFRVVHTGNMGRKQGLEHVVEAALLAAAGGAALGGALTGAVVGPLALRLVTGQADDPAPVWSAWSAASLGVAAVTLAVTVLVESSLRRRERLGEVLRVGER